MKSDNQEVRKKLQKVEELVNAIESSADPRVRASAIELIQALMELHGAGIERMMEIIFESGSHGIEIIDRFTQDDLPATLLLLYGLHPVDIETRVLQALNKVRPYLRSHGGNVELLGVADGGVQLRLQGSCHGCASSEMTLKLAIEEAIYEAAPDVTSISVEGVAGKTPATDGLVQMTGMTKTTGLSTGSGSGWEDVSGLTTLGNGTLRRMDVAGRPVIFCRLGETFYAYSDSCPGCGKTMAPPALESSNLVCPSCGQRFDVLRAGRGLDKPNLHLEPFPLLVEQGQTRIALPLLQN